MSVFDQDTIAIDDVADLNDFEEEVEFNQPLFTDENGAIYFYLYFIEFYGFLILDPDTEESEELLMSDGEVESFMEEEDDFRRCYNYNEECQRED